MGDKEGQAISWWGYLTQEEQTAVVEMVYRMTTEDMEAHGLHMNEDEELYYEEG